MEENPYESPRESGPRWSWHGRRMQGVPVWPFWLLLLAMAVAIAVADLLWVLE